MRAFNKIFISILLLTISGQLFCNDSWWTRFTNYISSWKSSVLANAASSTGTWIKENPGKTTLALSGLTAAGIACYIYKNKKQCDIARPEDIIVSRFTDNQLDINDIFEANRNGSFIKLPEQGAQLLGKPGNSIHLKDILKNLIEGDYIFIIAREGSTKHLIGLTALHYDPNNLTGNIEFLLLKAKQNNKEAIINMTLNEFKKETGATKVTLSNGNNSDYQSIFKQLGFELTSSSENGMANYTKELPN